MKGSGIASIPEVCIDMYEFFCNAWMHIHVAEIYRHLQSEDFSLMGNPLRVWLVGLPNIGPAAAGPAGSVPTAL